MELCLPTRPCQRVKKAGSSRGVTGSQSSWKPPAHPHQPGATHVSGRLCQAGARTCSLLLAEVCSAASIQAGQTQSFLCEHGSSKPMECRGCHYNMQVSCLKAKKPQRQKNITLHPCPHLVGSPILTKGCSGVHTLYFESTCGKLHTDPLKKTKKYPLNTEPILLFCPRFQPQLQPVQSQWCLSMQDTDILLVPTHRQFRGSKLKQRQLRWREKCFELIPTFYVVVNQQQRN